MMFGVVLRSVRSYHRRGALDEMDAPHGHRIERVGLRQVLVALESRIVGGTVVYQIAMVRFPVARGAASGAAVSRRRLPHIVKGLAALDVLLDVSVVEVACLVLTVLTFAEMGAH